MRAIISIIVFVIAGITDATWAQDPPQRKPAVEVQKMDVYACPRHRRIQATWPGQCPMCRRRSRRGQNDRLGRPSP